MSYMAGNYDDESVVIAILPSFPFLFFLRCSIFDDSTKKTFYFFFLCNKKNKLSLWLKLWWFKAHFLGKLVANPLQENPPLS